MTNTVEPQDNPKPRNNARLFATTVLLIILVVVLIIVVLALLGPAIGNIYTPIIRDTL